MNTNTKRLVQTSLLIALQIVLSRFLSIQTPIIRISFAFLPMALVAILHGPAYAAAAGVISDFFGAILFPAGAYFVGFTISALLRGLIYGFFIHKKPTDIKRITAAVSINCLVINLMLNSYWLSIIMAKGIFAILPTRVLHNVLMIPIQAVTIYTAGKLLERQTNFETA